MEFILGERRRQGQVDLEATEGFIRSGVHRCGALILEGLLAHEDGSQAPHHCRCGGRWQDRKRRDKTIMTVLGSVRLRSRTMQRCEGCGAWRAAEDVVLDVVGTGFSPGLRRMMARTGAELAFDKAQELIWELAGVRVTDKDVERKAEGIGEDLCAKEDARVAQSLAAGPQAGCSESPALLYVALDGTGVPVLQRETEGRKGKGDNGIARTREVKLAALFTQSKVNVKGEPLRDPHSTSYVGRIESAEAFGSRVYSEALSRGLSHAGKVVVLGDGAAWIWNLAEEHFPEAVQIVDFYHASEHIGELAKILHPADEVNRKACREDLLEDLWAGSISALMMKLRSLRLRGSKKQHRDREAEYFANNKNRMQYGKFRAQGLFVGSMVVEAGCKNLIGQRLKRSGMRWTVRGANSIITLRCCIQSGRFEDYWEQRAAA